jgi:hypothetical protein
MEQAGTSFGKALILNLKTRKETGKPKRLPQIIEKTGVGVEFATQISKTPKFGKMNSEHSKRTFKVSVKLRTSL